MSRLASVEFDSRHYVMAHGNEPRGRGGWAFEIPKAQVDMAGLRRSVASWNAEMPELTRSGSARLDETLYPDLALVWMPSSTFGAAKSGARKIFAQSSPNASLLVRVST